MKQTTIKILIIFSFITTAFNGSGQDPHFSQFYTTPLYVSPSYTGATPRGRAVLNFRTQWINLPKAFTTFLFSYDNNFQKKNFGLGINLFRDQAGTGRIAYTGGSALYSYNFIVREKFSIRPGISFSFYQISNDFLRHTFYDQINLDGDNLTVTKDNFINKTQLYPDAAASVMLHTKDYWIGFTAHHLLQQNQSLIEAEDIIHEKFTVFAGANVYIGRKLSRHKYHTLSFATIYQKQGPFNQMDFLLMWKKYPYAAGLSYRGMPVFDRHVDYYRSMDAVTLHLGYNYEEWRFGYSYDLTISKLATATGGAHEISIVYELDELLTPRKHKGAIPCPKI